MLIIRIPLCQKGTYHRHILHARFFCPVEHAIRGCAPAAGVGMHQLGIVGGIIIQNNCRSGNTFGSKGAEHQVIF